MSFSGNRAFEYVKKLSEDIGPRPSGTEAERRAAEWISSEFRGIGLDARMEVFDAYTGNVISHSLEVLKPYKEEMACESTPLMGSTGPDGVEGDLIYLDSFDEEYITESITRKIIITSGSPTDLKKSFLRMRTFSPAGIIFVETTPRAFIKHLWGVRDLKKFFEIPMVRVSFEDGLKLIKSKAERVRLTSVTEEKSVKSQNVVAEIHGSSNPEEIIIVGGHYDTVLDVAGAGDNAGGTAIVLELAKTFKDRGTKRTLRFVAWGCEELGLVGSRSQATKMRQASEAKKKKNPDVVTELEKTLLCLNMDVHGGLIGTNDCSVLGPPELVTAIKLLSKEKGTVFKVIESVNSSDCASMSAVGIPSLSLMRDTPTNKLMHSVEDSIKYLGPSALGTHGLFTEEFLRRYVTEAAAWPFDRLIPEKQRKEIEEYFQKVGEKLP